MKQIKTFPMLQPIFNSFLSFLLPKHTIPQPPSLSKQQGCNESLIFLCWYGFVAIDSSFPEEINVFNLRSIASILLIKMSKLQGASMRSLEIHQTHLTLSTFMKLLLDMLRKPQR